MIEDKTIWVLEQDPTNHGLYSAALVQEFDLSFFCTIHELMESIGQSDHPALLISDRPLTESQKAHWHSDAFDLFLKEVPFIIISDIDEVTVIKECFDQGAKFYIHRPFGMGELLAKVGKVISEDATYEEALINLDPISFKINRSELFSDKLTLKEFQILSLIHSCPSWRAQRTDIVQALWGDVTNTPKALDVHIFNLRRKVNQLGLQIKFDQPDRYSLIVSNDSLVQ